MTCVFLCMTGIWLLASLNTHESNKGLRVKFKDVECFRDIVIEEEKNYDEYIVGLDTFSVWKPIDEMEIMKEKNKPTSYTNAEIDSETDSYENLFRHRTLRDEGNTTDNVEQLDLTILNFDDSLFDNSSSPNEEITNKTHFQLDIDANNNTGTGLQNKSTEDVSSILTLISSHIKSPNNFTRSFFTNSTTKSHQLDTESQVQLKYLSKALFVFLSKQNSKIHVDNAKEIQTKELSLMSTVEDGQDKEGSSDDVLIHPASNTIIKVQKVDFVLLDKQTETVPHQFLFEYNYSSAALSNNTKKPLDNITQTVASRNIQVFNHTIVNSDHFSTNYTLSNFQIYSEYTQKDFTEHTNLNKSKVVSKLILEINKQINSTQVKKKSNNSQVQKKLFQSFNSPQNETDLIAEGFHDLNGTHVSTDFTLNWFTRLNISKPHSILNKFKEVNSTQHQSIAKIQGSNSKEPQNDFSRFILSNDRKERRLKVQLASLISLTDHAHNETFNLISNKLLNSTKKCHFKGCQNITSPIIFNILSPKINVSQTEIDVKSYHFEEDILNIPKTEESHDEVVIIIKNGSHSKMIVSSSLDPQTKSWLYEGKHELLSMAFPDPINKYIKDNADAQVQKQNISRSSGVDEVRKKVIIQRVAPVKGYGMKTKKRKEYRPQPQNGISPHVFSPRGFAPSNLTPRTTKPIFNEENILAKPIVIGVPRDFNDYELFAHYQGQNFDLENIPNSTEEYEYVEYKDPYRKQSDMKTIDIQEASKYPLNMAGSNTRAYFITAEEVNWDYAGYGQRYF